jgi:predicted adenine nucleotide alpha hydrolase (AANH) superfamily ATPase
MKKVKELIQTPLGETTVLLHTCCAPCSSAIIEALMQNGITPVIYYCNPNIYPQEEYEIRKNECTRYAQSLGLEIVDADYDHDNWLEAMKGLENEPERGGRCLKCFKIRLLRTAEYAACRGIKVITTTLASSRWKSLDQINEAGLWACNELQRRFSAAPFASARCSENIEAATVPDPNLSEWSVCPHGAVGDSRLGVNSVPPDDAVIWWDRNWRKNGLQERRLQIIKEYDFYNQLYCGCEFSMRKEI